MRHLLAGLLATTLLGGSALAQAPAEPPARSGMPNPHDDRALAGKIRRMEGKRIVLDNDPEPLWVDSHSVILHHGKPADARALKPGDEVAASFTFRNGHRVARTLSVLTPSGGQGHAPAQARTPPAGRGSSF